LNLGGGEGGAIPALGTVAHYRYHVASWWPRGWGEFSTPYLYTGDFLGAVTL